MTDAEFWSLVTRTEPQQTEQQCHDALKDKLTQLDDDSLAAFDKMFGQQMRRSYTWSIWGAAYIITGCDSDYAFAEFRGFLLSLGEQWYNKVINEPDCLGDIALWPTKDGSAYPFIEDYDLVAGQLYEDRTGDELPFVPSGQHTPLGKKFSTKKKDLRKNYPKLSDRFPF
ncbi:DUF4240 domain-containing protein [Shewanella olleyana]|uniref:DUF4240 domain-containing protein n=1 Tax=Shewanella olleyana TaxID=135626 RepID=UPI00200E2245|nr:DUF4240 domain-containing protein [Shewanella olleyana]MCL1068617.1 DUF4240 domain-containing protein [Shewanella olleyana]